jgi:hypothetical protein
MTRPGRRIFGEAKVLSTQSYLNAWYGSFKWLTSPKWCSRNQALKGYPNDFREALLSHFSNLCDLQDIVLGAARALADRKPVSPDLWLITRRKHRLIEVKLPGDSLADHQLLGLALIAMCARSDRPVSVEVFRLFESRKPEDSQELVGRFDVICDRLAATVDAAGGAKSAGVRR